MHVEIRGQPLPPRWALGSNSGHWGWLHVPLPLSRLSNFREHLFKTSPNNKENATVFLKVCAACVHRLSQMPGIGTSCVLGFRSGTEHCQAAEVRPAAFRALLLWVMFTQRKTTRVPSRKTTPPLAVFDLAYFTDKNEAYTTVYFQSLAIPAILFCIFFCNFCNFFSCWKKTNKTTSILALFYKAFHCFLVCPYVCMYVIF